MFKHVLVITSLLLVVGCSFLRGRNNAPTSTRGTAKTSNQFHAHYYTIDASTPGKFTCVPKGALKLLLDDCARGLETCHVGLDAASGSSSSDSETLFADMIERTETAFAYECVGLSRPATGPDNLHLLGLQGLGLMASDACVDRLVAVDDVGRRTEPWHIAMRPDLAFALWQTGDRERALPKLIELATLEGTDDSTRARIVLHVGAMDHSGLTDLCTKQLNEPANDDLLQACAWYAARLKIPDAVALITKADTKLGLAGIRVLGLTGDTKAVEPVTRAMNPLTASDNQRIVARVALLNLGKKEALRDYLNLIAGNAGPRKAANATPKLPSDELSRESALEAIALQNRNFDKDIAKALHKLTSSKNEETAIAAWIALAYIGEDSAFDTLAQTLAGADDGLRLFILENVGGLADKPGRHYATGGSGVLTNPRLSSAIASTYQGAPMEAAGRAQAVAALSAMRGATHASHTSAPATSR